MYYIILSVFFPILAGTYLLVRKEMKTRRSLLVTTGVSLLVTAVLAALALCLAGEGMLTLFNLTDRLPVLFKVDGVSVIFSAMTVIVFVCAGFFSFEYMKHEQKEKRYYGFYLIVFGVLLALCFAGNLITFYLFFELLTLSSMPLVLHNGSKEAIMAGLKYLFYSLCGAYLSLFGLYFIESYGNTLTFSPGGVFSAGAIAEHGTVLLVTAMLMLIGFGVKAGMFPLHAWLCGSFGSNRKGRGAWYGESRLLHFWGFLSAGKLGADSVDVPYASYGFYGFHACLQRTGAEKETGLLDSQSVILYFVWTFHYGNRCSEGRTASCVEPWIYQGSPFSLRRSDYL